jgi:hypothetical protein
VPPEQASDQKRMYGALLRALIQGKGNQPPIKHGYAHPEIFHPATKTKPARPTIPRSKWDNRLWLNHVADRYASHDFTPEMVADNLRPRRVFRIRVEDLLSEVMSPDSLFWSSARIPSVNFLCSMNSSVIESARYLQQRDAQTANKDPHQIQYYPLGYWSNSAIGLIKPVLDKLAGKHFSDLRVALLNLIWDDIPTGRRKGMFLKKYPDNCPLCGLPDSLDHIVLRCTSLNSIRQQIKRDVNGCTALDFTEYRPITQTNDTEVPQTSTQASDVQSPTAQPVDRGRDRLPRGAKVNLGYTENHAMQSDITIDGKLPPNFISRKGELYSYGKDKPN